MTLKKMIASRKMNRREFLAFSAISTLSAMIAACQGQTAHGADSTPTTRPKVTPSPTVQLTPSSTDWSALSSNLQGTLVLPNSANYATALQLFDTQFDSIHPAAIAYCASPADVQQCLAFVRRFNLPLAARCGGHSYAGYSTSTGLVIDVTRMNTVTVDTTVATATIGAGTRLIDVYSALTQHGVIIPAGSCPTVGVAGLTLGGGAGVLGRKFGLTCDNLLSAQVVTADGNVLTCDANNHADLFWALCGGGGGNFGVVTAFTFQTHAISQLAIFTLDWPWSSAVNVVDAWQHWGPQAIDEVWSNCLLLANSDKSAGPTVRVNGVYVGNVTALNPLLQQLTSQINAPPTGNYVYNETLLDTMMIEAGCYGKSVAECHLPSQNPQGQLQRDTSAAKSDYFTSLLPRQGIQVLVNAIAQRQASSILGGGGIGMDSYGGAINRVAPDATAFVHRNALFSAQYNADWNASDPASVVSANRAWLNNTWQAMRSYASGQAYQNYIDPDLPNWLQAYYGANLPRLQSVKATYDPGNLFHFKQSIPLP